jgi:hypothetical protein
MQIIKRVTPAMIIADEGKHIRDARDVYKEAYVDEKGIYMEEHFPAYHDVIFIPNDMTDEEINEIFIEEDKPVEE